jgi:hypothetical protein
MTGNSTLPHGSSTLPSDHCVLFPGLFGLLVQLALFCICIVALVLKKLREGKERTWFVFGLDSSKQVVGAGFVHCLNVIIAWLLPDIMPGDACDWYWLNLMVDTTLGVFLEYLLFLSITWLMLRIFGDDATAFHSGDYYSYSRLYDHDGYSEMDDNESYDDYGMDYELMFHKEIYFKQLVFWLCCISGMKLLVIVIFLYLGNIFLSIAAIFLIVVSWNPKVKLVFVMLITPGIMNVVQFWLTDAFIKKDGVQFREFMARVGQCFQNCFHRIRRKEIPSENGVIGQNHSRDGVMARVGQCFQNCFHRIRRKEIPCENGVIGQNHSREDDEISLPRSHRSYQSNGMYNARSGMNSAALRELEQARQQVEQAKQQLEKERESLEFDNNRLRSEKEKAEKQMRKFQEEKFAAEEKLHKAEQDKRLLEQEVELSRQAMKLAKDHEIQLQRRNEQLEFSYSQAGAAANAVFAAEVSTAAVAAASCRSAEQAAHQAYQRSYKEIREARALTAADADDVIKDFLTPSASPPRTPAGSSFPAGPPQTPPNTMGDLPRHRDPRMLHEQAAQYYTPSNFSRWPAPSR